MILLRTLFSMVSATASLLPFSFPRRLATASTMSVFAISSSKPMCSAERDRTRISERPLVFRSAGAVVPAQPARHLLRLHVHRLEVELAVEVHDDDAVAALFALVIMDLSRRLRPHGSMPAGNFCRISEAPSFGFPHTANICSPGCLGSTGFHGMASLAVKVPWVAPAFAPAAGVEPVPRSCAKVWVEVVLASAPTTLANTILFSMDGLLLGKVGMAPRPKQVPCGLQVPDRVQRVLTLQ